MEDTSASAPEAVEAVEAAAVDTAEATGEAPETVEQAEAVETPKRPSWSDELAKVEAISPQAAELMRKMQGDYTRKPQELADQYQLASPFHEGRHLLHPGREGRALQSHAVGGQQGTADLHHPALGAGYL